MKRNTDRSYLFMVLPLHGAMSSLPFLFPSFFSRERGESDRTRELEGRSVKIDHRIISSGKLLEGFIMLWIHKYKRRCAPKYMKNLIEVKHGNNCMWHEITRTKH